MAMALLSFSYECLKPYCIWYFSILNLELTVLKTKMCLFSISKIKHIADLLFKC